MICCRRLSCCIFWFLYSNSFFFCSCTQLCPWIFSYNIAGHPMRFVLFVIHCKFISSQLMKWNRCVRFLFLTKIHKLSVKLSCRAFFIFIFTSTRKKTCIYYIHFTIIIVWCVPTIGIAHFWWTFCLHEIHHAKGRH